MKKNIILIVFALLLLGGCKKDKDVRVAKVQAETPDVTTTANAADISGTYSYASTLKSVVIVYGKDASLSSPQKATAEHTRDSYSVTINNLDPGTTYYYYCIFDTGYGASESEQESFTTQSVSALTVTTSSVSNITQTTATCGGNVTSNGGATVTARGVCWSTSQNPTVSNSHTTNGSGTGSFTSNITGLTANTKYYVRAYATNSAGTSYGEQKSFTTLSSGGGDHEYVDLGLPSGTLWATCNVGADNPEDYGDHFAWGETESKSTYDWSTYKWCNGSETTLTKYNTDPNYGTVDDKTILDLEDDAAHVNWGDDWRMPTYDEKLELFNYCTWIWTTQNGVTGTKFTGTNGNSIFIPDDGYYNAGNIMDAGSGSYCWSSSLYTYNPCNAFYWYSLKGNLYSWYCGRCFGLSVRPVRPSQSVSAPTVTTSSVSNITQTTATCGGSVTSDGGATVTARGVCWSTSQNPTVSNSHTTNGSGTGSFTSNITGLTKNTTYYVRAYATNGKGTSYGEQKSFTTSQSGGGGEINGHEYVDLGLPSGLLWATCNIGASKPEDYGNYYAWGETEPKSTYNWGNYKWCNGSENTLTKYCTDWIFGTVDHRTTLEPADDAAHVNWGGSWRMPTIEEMSELVNNCISEWTTQNGVQGRKFTGSNGSSIFLPAAGFYDGGNLYESSYKGNYWSSSLNAPYYPNYARELPFDSSNAYLNICDYRCYGNSVRPVCPSQK